MAEDLLQQVRWLKRYSILSTVVFLTLAIFAFRNQPSTGKFQTLDVERINVITKDGRHAVVIANAERLPGNIVGGKEHPYGGRRAGGVLFYNRDGDEAGGLLFDNDATDTLVSAFGQLSLDRYGSDQVAALRYLESPDGWESGLQISHFAKGALFEWHASRDSLLRLPPTQRDSAIRRLRERFFREGKFEVKRVFVGQAGRDAILRMNDTRGRPRILMVVDSLDVPRIQILDDKGKVIQRLPG